VAWNSKSLVVVDVHNDANSIKKTDVLYRDQKSISLTDAVGDIITRKLFG